MKWVPYPTKFKDDPRLDAAGEAAEVLHNRAWAWCGDQEEDGRIPKGMVARLCPRDTAARVDALLEHDLWQDAGDAYVLLDWAKETSEVRGLESGREKARLRQQRKRDRDRAAAASSTPTPQGPAPSRDTPRDSHAPARTTTKGAASSASRSGRPRRSDQHPSALSRDCHVTGGVTVTPLEREEIYNPPNPPASWGDDDPSTSTTTGCWRHPDKPGRRCRHCGTTPRQLADATAAAEARAAEAAAADLVTRRAAVPHCGHPDCDRIDRTFDTGRGIRKCRECHPDVVVGPAPRPQLAVVGGA